ncbi:MAG: DMT family transporter, partial [Micropruina sp.]
VRLGIASLLLLVPALIALRGRWQLVRPQAFALLGYGLFAGVLPQVSFFNAVQRIPIGIGLLLEYLGIVWVVVWAWLRTRDRPGSLTMAGMGTALVGLLIILNPFQQVTLDPIGVLWGLLAGVGLAVYFVISAETEGLPPVVFVSFGLGIGAIGLAALGALGVVPMAASIDPVTMLGGTVAWWLPVLVLAVFAAAVAYLLGFIGAQWLGATMGSFVGLTEVVFAVLWAWLLLAELPGGWQLAGGLVLLTGVAVVRLGSARDAVEPESAPVSPREGLASTAQVGQH